MRARMPLGGTAAEAQARRSAYYDYVGSGGAPKIAIIQDLDPVPGFNAQRLAAATIKSGEIH